MTCRCEECGKLKENVRLRERTGPDLRLTWVRLCTPCARAGGWADTTFDRGRQVLLGEVNT